MDETDPSSFFDYVREVPLLHARIEPLITILDVAATLIDLVACVILVIGAARFVWGFFAGEVSRNRDIRMRRMNSERIELGRYILGGLELLIVSDIVHTAISLAMADLVFLGLLVIIRSLISFFLERELDAVRRELDERQ